MMSIYRVKSIIGRLHIIISDDNGGRPTRSAVELTDLSIRGGADTIQYRRKHGSLRSILEEGKVLHTLCRERGVPLIINDRVDVCLAIDADGVHLGEFDMPVDDARRILGSSKIIGATVRNVDDLKTSISRSADYVGCGPVFSTTTKNLFVEPLGVAGLKKITQHSSIPVIGIAGIDESNVDSVLLEGGAWGIAVISAVAAANDPESVVRRLKERINSKSSMKFS